MKKGRIITGAVFFFLIVMTVTAFGADVDVAAQNAQKFGIFTIIPPLVAIVLSFITKNVVLSLYLGVFSGALILSISGANIIAAVFHAFLGTVNYMVSSLADSWNAGIIFQCLTIGGLIALISKMGGAKAVAESLAKKAKTPRSAQIVTLVMGIFVFFDDYANSLIVGPIMRPVTDKLRISREKLSFIVDATAAPVAGIALISTWVGYEVGLIKDAYGSIGQEVNAYGIFAQTIPYRFYNILILAFIFFIALFLKDFGPMLKAEKRAWTTGKVIADGSKPMVSDEATGLEPAEGVKLSIWNAIIPIGTLIIAAMLGFYYNGYTSIMGGEDKELIAAIQAAPVSFTAIRETFSASDASLVLFQSALLASIVTMVMGISKKIFTISESIDVFIQGLKSLLITGVILVLAWSLSGVIKELGTAKYIVSMVSDSLPAFMLPALIFILGSIISFATGTSYGTMGILMPLTVPLAHAILPDPGYIIMCVGGVLTGAIFGDHCSPISDTTILSSMGSACDHMDHTKTQVWYALTVAALTVIFGYLPVGFGLNVWIVLPIALAATGATVYFFGKPVEKGISTTKSKTKLA